MLHHRLLAFLITQSRIHESYGFNNLYYVLVIHY